MMIPLFSVSLPRCSMMSLLAKVLGPGDDDSTLLSLLAKVLGPGDDDSTLLSLLAKVLGPRDDDSTLLRGARTGG